jgi:hypothetical protein
MEYYSGIKKNEIMIFAGKWTELEIIMLSKVRQGAREQDRKGGREKEYDYCISGYV